MTTTNAAETSAENKVEQILHDIEMLPQEYRALVTKIDAWETGHVVLALIIAFACGFGVALATLAVF